MRNKAIPLAVTKSLLRFEKLIESETLEVVSIANDNLMNLECKYLNEIFFFKIHSHQISQNGSVIYKFSLMPSNDQAFKPIEHSSNFEGINQWLKKWITLINEYHSTGIPFEDKFQKNYEEQFSTIFSLVEKDADTSPFPIETQKNIYDVLEKIVLYLEQAKTDDNSEEFSEIVAESRELQSNLTTSVKSRVFNSFISISAKLWKLGIVVFQGALGNLAFEGLKKIFLGM